MPDGIRDGASLGDPGIRSGSRGRSLGKASRDTSLTPDPLGRRLRELACRYRTLPVPAPSSSQVAGVIGRRLLSLMILVRCPSCRQPFSPHVGGQAPNLICPSCGKRFELTDEHERVPGPPDPPKPEGSAPAAGEEREPED